MLAPEIAYYLTYSVLISEKVLVLSHVLLIRSQPGFLLIFQGLALQETTQNAFVFL